MGIHHATVKKAEKMGVVLTEQGDKVLAHWTEYNVRLISGSATDALKEMQAVQAIKNMKPDLKIEVLPSQEKVNLWEQDPDEDGLYLCLMKGCPMSASEAHALIVKGAAEFSKISEEFDEAAAIPDMPETEVTAEEVQRSEKGIALDGAVAYAEGTPAGDNPYVVDDGEEETDEIRAAMEKWDEDWDAAADAAEGEKSDGGSVVKSTYRALYAEQGHPTHCGDWMAETLNALCQTSKGIDLTRFETVCEANGVDLSKYNRETRGWEGRLRMTGRNLLAKKVYLAGGVMKTPLEGADPEYKAPKDWMEKQKYKMPKKDQAKPIPEAEASE